MMEITSVSGGRIYVAQNIFICPSCYGGKVIMPLTDRAVRCVTFLFDCISYASMSVSHDMERDEGGSYRGLLKNIIYFIQIN